MIVKTIFTIIFTPKLFNKKMNKHFEKSVLEKQSNQILNFEKSFKYKTTDEKIVHYKLKINLLKTFLKDCNLSVNEHNSYVRSLRNSQTKLNKIRTKFLNYKDLYK